ncbi:MAG: NADH-quinone oxidoreductase subunit NuoG, partial [Acidimicrobiaceae bacterium]
MTDEVRTTVSITVNGRSFEARAGELLIEAAERAGDYIPRFCYHPRMEPVGICRMCLVEVDGPRGATLQPACYLKVTDGMSVVTSSEKVKKAQDGVLEFLLANHPLDCPVCDKGGECPLQDQSLAHGSGETRFIEEKRHFVKPIEIGELVLLDRERCIQCARCTRFAAEVAGDAQISFSGRGDLIEVAPSPTQPFDSVFSGNTVQICPVGALTAKPYRFSARPWDLEQVESTCTTCAVGCRVAVQSSGNRLTRVLGVDSDPVNHGWLCDKGRFTLDSVDGNEDSTDLLSAATRLSEPMIRRNGELVSVSWSEALSTAAKILTGEGSSLGVIGGSALTNEGAFAWERFARGVLRTENIDAQYGDGLDAELLQALPKATIDDAARACTVVTLTGDLREELPILFLRLRESAVRDKNSIVELVGRQTSLSNVAKSTITIRPGEAHLAAKALVSGTVPFDVLFTSEDIVNAQKLIGNNGEGVVFVVGRANVAENSSVVEAAIRIFAENYPAAKFLVALRRSNVNGALDMGLSPGLLPGRCLNTQSSGRDTIAQLQAMASGEQKATLLLGGCLLGNIADTSLAIKALEASEIVVVSGHGGATLAYADVVLPASVSYERVGTVTNIEGRVSALTPKIVPPGSAWTDVAIASELAEEYGQSIGLDSVEETSKIIEATTGYPAMSVLTDAHTDGVVVDSEEVSLRRSMDPMAFPGIRTVKSVGLGAPSGATVVDTVVKG